MPIKKSLFSGVCCAAFLAVIAATAFPTIARFAYRSATFDPANATFPLSDCARLGTPPMVTLRNGKFRTPSDNPIEPYSVEIALQRVFHVSYSDTHADIAELSCARWGANSSIKEWFLFGADGHVFDRLDERRIRSDYRNAYPDDGDIWAGTEIVKIEKDRVIAIEVLAGGSHAVPAWISTLRYRADVNDRLQMLGAITRRPLPAPTTQYSPR